MRCCTTDDRLTMSKVSRTLCAGTDNPVYHSNDLKGRSSKIPNAHTSCNVVADLSGLELDHRYSSNTTALVIN